MNSNEQWMVRRVQWTLVGLFSLGLMACDPQSPPGQTGQSGRAAEQSASPATGTQIDQANPGQKDDIAKAGQTVDDLALNIKVEAALNADPALKSQPISVRTVGGVVVLSGTAQTNEARDQATQLAMAVTGVKSVDNKLEVAGS